MSLKRWIAGAIATAFGAGLVPRAPGTAGTAVALPLAYLIAEQSPGTRILFWLGVFIAGCWAARIYDEWMQSTDNQRIVIDEVVGLGITAFTVGRSPIGLLLAFVLFRVFDILKPPPVRFLDQWSKIRTPISAGVGVMIDDVAAGFLALLVIVFLQYFDVLPL